MNSVKIRRDSTQYGMQSQLAHQVDTVTAKPQPCNIKQIY